MALLQVAQYVQNRKPGTKPVNLTILDPVSKKPLLTVKVTQKPKKLKNLITVNLVSEQYAHVWIMGDSIIHWAGQHYIKYSPECWAPNQLQFQFDRLQGADIWRVAWYLHTKIQAQDTLPDLIFIHVGTNNLSQEQISSTKQIIKEKFSQICNTIFNKLPYSGNAHNFQGIVWSAIIPRLHYNNSSSQKAAQSNCKCINTYAKQLVLHTNWYLDHTSFEKIKPENYHLPDKTHL